MKKSPLQPPEDIPNCQDRPLHWAVMNELWISKCPYCEKCQKCDNYGNAEIRLAGRHK